MGANFEQFRRLYRISDYLVDHRKSGVPRRIRIVHNRSRLEVVVRGTWLECVHLARVRESDTADSRSGCFCRA